jgi:hypothetical protein
MRKALLVGLVLLFGTAAFAAPVQGADGVTVSSFPISFSFFNPCTNENVDVSGTALVVRDTTADDHGLVGHSVNIAVKGIGETTGMQYVAVFANTFTANTSDNGASTETITTYERFVTPGPGNDLLFAIVFHETFDANGDLVVRFNRPILGVCT